jgi:outer membrane immunogenic protein
MPARWVAPPPAEAPWSWTGFYIGGGAGGSWTRSETKLTLVNGATPLFAAADVGRVNFLGSPNLASLTGAFGGRVGYNYQTGPYVWGLEGDVWSIRSHKSINSAPGNPFVGVAGGFAAFNTSVNNDWVATIGPRFGFTIDRVMLYALGGVAFGNVNFTSTYLALNAAGVNFANASASQTQVGWTVGGGLDYGINRNWILSVDYQHIDLGYQKTSALVTTVGAANTATFNFSTLVHTDIFTLGLAYKF